MRSDRERLLDIEEAIGRIESRAGISRASFDGDELVQTWMVHWLQVIGEAARALSQELQSRHSELPWSEIIGMRTILVHHYFRVDPDAVWQAATVSVPRLKAQVRRILETDPEFTRPLA
jgi:uncharacterized protein with HEPN domain